MTGCPRIGILPNLRVISSLISTTKFSDFVFSDNLLKAEYDRTLLWIKEGLWLPVQYQLFESGGEIINTIELNHIEINKEMPNKTFSLDLPDNVEIIEPFK